MEKYICGTIEMGGTKTKCAIAVCDEDKKSLPIIMDQTEFATTMAQKLAISRQCLK